MVSLPLIFIGLTSANVSLEFRAGSVAGLLERLSIESGTKLKSSPSLARETVVVKVKDVSLADLKLKLASALDATWVTEGSVEYLKREAPQEKAIWNRHVQVRREYVEAELSRIRKRAQAPFDAAALVNGLKSLPTEDEVKRDPTAQRRRYKTEAALYAQGPVARLLDQLVLACDPDDLAAMDAYSRTVFRPQPNRRQRALDPKQLAAARADFSVNQRMWQSAAQQANFPEGGTRMVSDPRVQAKLDAAAGWLVGLEAFRGEMSALCMMNLVRNDPDFGISTAGQVILADPSRQLLDAEVIPIANDPEISLTPDSKEILETINGIFMNATMTTAPESTRRLLLQPDARDPLAFGVTDAVFSYADAEKANVVAALPDDAFGMVGFASKDHAPRVYETMNSLVKGGVVTLTKSGEWITITPRDRYEASQSFTPRVPMAKLMDSVQRRGTIDARDYATFAFQSGRLPRFSLSEIYLSLYDRSVLSSLDRVDWEALRLYGSFSELEQKSLAAGKSFLVGAMSPAQKAIVDRIVFSQMLASEEKLSANETRLGTQPLDPTDAFPDGTPPSATVSARYKPMPTLVAYGKDKGGQIAPLRTINVDTIASLVADGPPDPATLKLYGLSGLVGYAVGNENLVALRINLREGLWKELSFMVPDYDTKATPAAWKDLPAPYPKQITAAVLQVKAEKAAQPGRVIPPQ